MCVRACVRVRLWWVACEVESLANELKRVLLGTSVSGNSANRLILCVCACACVCVRVCVIECVCVCVCVCDLSVCGENGVC